LFLRKFYVFWQIINSTVCFSCSNRLLRAVFDVNCGGAFSRISAIHAQNVESHICDTEIPYTRQCGEKKLKLLLTFVVARVTIPLQRWEQRV